MSEFIITLAVALITGIVAGVSAGLIVARMARFEELRNEAIRIIWGIDYIYTETEIAYISELGSTGELQYVSSELYALKHVAAGDTISRLLQEITETLINPPNNVDAMNEQYSNWQRTCGNLKPERKVIFNISWTP